MPKYISVSAAAAVLARVNRLLVIGCSGGGKTTLSRRISRHYGLAYQSLDRDVRWLPGWQVRDRDEQRELIAELAGRDRWVMDGSGAASFDLRLPRTDLVLWVRVPRRVALWGVAKRVWRHRGEVRFGMAEGCPEQLPDRAFLEYIWNFEKTYAPRFVASIERHGPAVPVAVLQSHREMERLFAVASAPETAIPRI